MQGQPIEIIIDTGSLVTIIPPTCSPIEVRKTTKGFVDVNKIPIKFKGEATVEVKTDESKEVLRKLITENTNTQPLLGLDWLKKLQIGLHGNKNTIIIHPTNQDRRKTGEDYQRMIY